MNAEALVAELRALGVHLEVAGDRIRYVVERPPIPNSALESIGANRDAVVAHLRSRVPSTAARDGAHAAMGDASIERADSVRIAEPNWECPLHGRIRPWRKFGNKDWNCPIHFEPQIDEALIEWMGDDGSEARDA